MRTILAAAWLTAILTVLAIMAGMFAVFWLTESYASIVWSGVGCFFLEFTLIYGGLKYWGE